ncbi:3-methyladenine DNA glycosylase AlkD [Brevibacterium aurantiacum]|uniref:3-methyladenine DNA glycosylase AlkD n=1 Tax=Brevibacterium aurantiacum TaxID=273384 RepID=A0A2H1KTL7_BREAU|nr:DNA alkylation repair protein [Brevibacterium aurantiacum]SMY03116.1 3-methyladenine DNA glycosylase AlkD [Brevibacterium aurantiacum]
MVEANVDSVMETLAAMEDPKARAVNEKHGDDHGVNLSKLRAVAKELKKNDELAVKLWNTGDTAARLVAILIMRPRSYDAQHLDAMLREARVPKVHGWLVNYIVKKSKHAESLRLDWMNETLSYIGIENEDLRPRAIDIGNRLGVLKDYPTPPNCTSPFAPTWITEIVARRAGA